MKKKPYPSVNEISFIFFSINLIVGVVAVLFNNHQIMSVLLLSDPSLFVVLYALTHRNLLGWIIMVGTLAGTVYTVVINQLLYIEILEILGTILFFGSPIVALFWVGTGTDSEDTDSIQINPPRTSHRSYDTDKCPSGWCTYTSLEDKYFSEQLERRFNESIREAQERQRELWKENED